MTAPAKAAAHTPGPYRIERVGDDTLEIWAHPRIAVGQLYGQDGPNESEIVWANARLFAAAPDLLAVVRELIGAIKDKSIQRNPAYTSDDIKWLDKRARAAVAKAESQS